MQLSGKQILHAVPSRVWALLTDSETLARIVPGITKLEKTGDHFFISTLEIKIGPVSGYFTGNLRLEDIEEPSSFTLKAQQNSKLGNANAAIKVRVVPAGDIKTELAFDGDAKLSGLLASMGQRVMGGVANTLIKQFFSNMDKELEKFTHA
ncbi:MAG: carbon monoxide dehydrogenase subunit G [Chitinophagaceae bacterium]